jgi:hypothetical protein
MTEATMALKMIKAMAGGARSTMMTMAEALETMKVHLRRVAPAAVGLVLGEYGSHAESRVGSHTSGKSSVARARSPAAESFSSEADDVVNPLPPPPSKPSLDADVRLSRPESTSTYQPWRPPSVTESAYGGAPQNDILRDINPPPSKARHYSVASIPREYQSFTDI